MGPVSRGWTVSHFLSLLLIPLVFFLLFPAGARATSGPTKQEDAAGAETVDLLFWAGGSWAGFLHGDTLPVPNYLGHKVYHFWKGIQKGKKPVFV
jgi:hypothetical protein